MEGWCTRPVCEITRIRVRLWVHVLVLASPGRRGWSKAARRLTHVMNIEPRKGDVGDNGSSDDHC